LLGKIYNHLLAPELALAAASAAAAKLNLKAFQVVGSNMAPTLEPQHIAWYQPLDGTADLARADVVAVRAKELGGVLVPSRVAGLAGETVELRDGVLVVNGLAFPEPYIDPRRAEQDYSLNHDPVTVPTGHVWLLGDFRDMSKDSRHLGALPAQVIVGHIRRFHLPGHHGNAQPLQ
jgi:signal peptidase I